MWVKLTKDTLLHPNIGQGYTQVMKVHNMLSHSHIPICQIWCAYVKEQRRSCPDTYSRWKYNIENKGQGHTKVMNVCDTSSYGDTLMWIRYGMTMSKDIKAVASWTQSQVKNPKKLTLRSKDNDVLGSWMYVTHPLMLIDQLEEYENS